MSTFAEQMGALAAKLLGKNVQAGAKEMSESFGCDLDEAKEFLSKFVAQITGTKVVKTKDPNAPKKMSGYQLYLQESKPEIKDEMQADGVATPKPSVIQTEAIRRWNSLTEEEQVAMNVRSDQMNVANGFVLSKEAAKRLSKASASASGSADEAEAAEPVKAVAKVAAKPAATPAKKPVVVAGKAKAVPVATADDDE